MREIVTVQVGGFANFIGSHFWNFQVEFYSVSINLWKSVLVFVRKILFQNICNDFFFWLMLKDELLGLGADHGSDTVFRNHHQFLNMDVLYRNGETQQVWIIVGLPF